jgi:(2R)-sulfolactate sulfo-lyase subunit beta
MKTEELKQEFMDVFNSYNEFIESKGVSLLGSQPTQGNIRGGLTTIEEKAMGNIQKIGNCQVDGVLAPAEAPDGKGLYFMDTSSAAAEAVTLFAAAGSVLHFFPTGQGNIVGHPVIPVVKLSANPLTVETMSEHIDLDVSKLLSLDMDLDEAGDALWSIMKRTLNGRKTAAEVLGHKEFVLTKLYRSA